MGSCIKCSHQNCKKWFHASCGVLAGYRFNFENRKLVSFCRIHRNDGKKVSFLEDTIISIERTIDANRCVFSQLEYIDEVKWIKKGNNNKYYRGRILQEFRQNFLAVCFSDGSIKCDVKPGEIKVSLLSSENL